MTHGFHDQLPKERFEGVDLVIHSGDCSNYMDTYRNTPEVQAFIKWYAEVPVEHKIYVAGNHDSSIERRKITPADFGAAGITYLENAGCYVEGISIWGSPITPTFGSWSFMKDRAKTHEVWQKIPDHTQILIVHGPPKGVRDLSFDREYNLEMCGDMSLTKRCYELKDTLELMCFGHIHNMDGVEHNQGISQYSRSKTIFSNAACVHDGRFDKGLTSFGNIITL